MARIKRDPNNANRGTEAGRALVRQSLAFAGAGRGIVVDRNEYAIGGNTTVAEWEAMGGKLRIVETTGDELVVTKRIDLDLESEDKDVRERSRLLAYYDNHSSFAGLDWNPEAFKKDIADGLDLSKVFTEDQLLVILEPELPDPSEEEDETFGDFSSSSSGDYVKFKFGDYAGQVERHVYESFLLRYKEAQTGCGAAILTDILAEMFK